MKISVMQHHIDNGRRASCNSDPIALALKEAGFYQPWVGPNHIAWRREFKDHSVETPEDVLGFMKKFDNGQLVEPFEFELEEV